MRGDLTTHFIDDHNIIDEVVKVVEHDLERGVTLGSVLCTPNSSKKVAAASVAVGAYVNAAKQQNQQTK